MTATLVPEASRRHFITCKFCPPSKLFLPMSLSDAATTTFMLPAAAGWHSACRQATAADIQEFIGLSSDF